MAGHSHEERVRLKAYEIWLNEGKPEGREQRHWEMAREMIGYEDARLSTLVPSNGDGGTAQKGAAAEVPSVADFGGTKRSPKKGAKSVDQPAVPVVEAASKPKAKTARKRAT
jgi:hypothetical protein